MESETVNEQTMINERSRLPSGYVVQIQIGSGLQVRAADVVRAPDVPKSYQRFGMSTGEPDFLPFDIACDSRFAKLNDQEWCAHVTGEAVEAIENWEKEQRSNKSQKEVAELAKDDPELVPWENEEWDS